METATRFIFDTEDQGSEPVKAFTELQEAEIRRIVAGILAEHSA